MTFLILEFEANLVMRGSPYLKRKGYKWVTTWKREGYKWVTKINVFKLKY